MKCIMAGMIIRNCYESDDLSHSSWASHRPLWTIKWGQWSKLLKHSCEALETMHLKHLAQYLLVGIHIIMAVEAMLITVSQQVPDDYRQKTWGNKK